MGNPHIGADAAIAMHSNIQSKYSLNIYHFLAFLNIPPVTADGYIIRSQEASIPP
jgi:hypothetical protein